MKHLKLYAGIFIIPLFFIMIGCAHFPKTKEKPTYQKKVIYSVSPSVKSKEGVTIKMEYINKEEIKKNPLYTQRVKSNPYGILNDDVKDLKRKKVYIDPFKNKLSFKVTIENKTNHILRMKNARVVFVEGKSMNNLTPALNKNTLVNSIPNHPKVLYYRNEETPIDDAIADSWVKALRRVYSSNQLKIINDVGMEIYPDFTASGILVFPISPSKAMEGKVNFFDITTKVDKAGNPIKKEHFDFIIKSKERYFKTIENETVEIKKDEYRSNKKKKDTNFLDSLFNN